MTDQSNLHVYMDWIKERLDEMDATLASLENTATKMQADSRVKADSALKDIRSARDTFRTSLKQHADASKDAFNRSKVALEEQWTAFETNVQTFMEAAGKQAKQQQDTFHARADAQRKTWQAMMDKLQHDASSLAAKHRPEVETALKLMKSEADVANAKLEKLHQAGSESWVAFKTALGETRASLERASQAVHEAFKRAA